jgi:ubiquinone/menaquinone biosynthesis C-methylase UbiE
MTSDSSPILGEAVQSAEDDGGESAWFNDHFHEAPRQIVEFLSGDGVALEGQRVADIGCGDGLIDLGLAHLARPAELVGYDIEDTDVDSLGAWARRHGVDGELPAGLHFQRCTPTHVPVPDATFDVVVSWSAFEHISEPVIMAREIRRILKPTGLAFVQIWPLYYSEHGSHRWPWFPGGFAQFLHEEGRIEEVVRSTAVADRVTADNLRDAELNRMTIDELQRCLLAGGLNVTKLELITQAVHVPPKLARYPLSWLGISGIKLIACPDPNLG